ncbi:MAG: AMP-binding protein [Halioglobus sp.]
MSLQSVYEVASTRPSSTAVVHDDTPVSYAGFAAAIATTCRCLQGRELPQDRTVVVMIRNLLHCWTTVLALQALGLNTVSVRSPAVLAALGLGKVATLVTTETDAESHEPDLDPSMGYEIIQIPAPTFDTEDATIARPFALGATPGGHILYTSGTTGNYKKIFWSGELQRRRNSERIGSMADFNASTVFHCADFGLWTAAGYKNPLATWHAGGCVILDQRPDWYAHFLQSGLTHTTLVPDKLHQLVAFIREQQPPPGMGDFRLFVTSGFLSHGLAEQIMNLVTRKLENAYGSTEASIMVLRSQVHELDDLHWLNPVPQRVVEIVDEQGRACPAGVEGEVRLRLLELDCHAYMDDPAASSRFFRDGCFYPGDMAMRRADGRVRILGRSTDVINLRGQKLSVAPVEQAIQARLGVAAVCLFSSITAGGDNELAIAIESARWPEKSVLDDLRHQFAEFEQVQFALLPQFPRTQTGTSKIDRITLRKLIYTDSATA